MTYKSILVHLGVDDRSDDRIRLGVALAKRFEAHLAGLFVIPSLIPPATFVSPLPMLGADLLDAYQDAMAELSAEVGARLTRLAEAEGVTPEVEVLNGPPALRLAERARYADLTLVGQTEEEGVAGLVRRLPEQVVLGSGRGLLVVPYAGRFERVGERVLVAWNGTREAARAVREAMPLLERAEAVIVYEMDPEDGAGGAALAAAHALARHGVRAEARHTVTAGVAPGEILLSAVADLGADLLVMGAYGHARVREIALGGVTRTVLGHMTVPVLMAY